MGHRGGPWARDLRAKTKVAPCGELPLETGAEGKTCRWRCQPTAAAERAIRCKDAGRRADPVDYGTISAACAAGAWGGAISAGDASGAASAASLAMSIIRASFPTEAATLPPCGRTTRNTKRTR